MGLANFAFQGSYTIISDVSHNKTAKFARILTKTYTNSTKVDELFSSDFPVGIHGSFSKSIVGVIAEPPSPLVQGATYIVKNGVGSFAGKSELLAYYTGDIWSHYPASTDETFIANDGKFYIHRDGVMYEIRKNNAAVFDQYFSVAAISGADNNIIKAGYTYLKTLPEFAGCTDV